MAYSNRMIAYDSLSAFHGMKEQGRKPLRVYPTEKYTVNLTHRELCEVCRALRHLQKTMNKSDERYDIAVDDALKIFENLT